MISLKTNQNQTRVGKLIKQNAKIFEILYFEVVGSWQQWKYQKLKEQ